MALSTYSISD